MYQDKARHTELNNQAQDVVKERQRVKFAEEEEKRVEQNKRTADAVAAGQRVMPKQYPGKGPIPPKQRLQAEKFAEFTKQVDRPRWNESDFIEGAYDKSAKHRSFQGDGDQCYRIGRWGRIKLKLNKADMPGNGPNGESITYADFRRNQPVYAVDMTGDGWSVVRFLPEETITVTKRRWDRSH